MHHKLKRNLMTAIALEARKHNIAIEYIERDNCKHCKIKVFKDNRQIATIAVSSTPTNKDNLIEDIVYQIRRAVRRELPLDTVGKSA